MIHLNDTQFQQLAAAIKIGRSRPTLAARVLGIYADVQRQIDLRRPRCDASGRCCRFEQFGHLLFVSTIELAAFAGSIEVARPGGFEMADPQPGCPFQIDGLCSVHTIRPLGCRIFFCDTSAELWQQTQYEQFHLTLRHLHDELDVPYFYVEWRQGLRAIRQTQK